MSIAEAARYSTPVEDCAIGKHRHTALRCSMRSGSAEQARRQRVVDVRFDGARAVECLADPDEAGVGVDVDPKQVRKLVEQDGLERGDLHLGRLLKSQSLCAAGSQHQVASAASAG